jgi:osmotically-inducible protein OsmY
LFCISRPRDSAFVWSRNLQSAPPRGGLEVALRDEVLAGIIRCRLAEDKRTSGQPIDVYVSDGDIFLLGTVDEEAQRDTAELIVSGLIGVREVIDRIQVRARATA